MGLRAAQSRKDTKRTIRDTPLSPSEKDDLKQRARYEGSPYHKRNPGDFGLTPPAAPRKDATLCDEASVFSKTIATELLERAIDGGLVSKATAGDGFPKELWVVHEGRVYEAMYGGSQPGYYHGYPIRRSDAFFDEILSRWSAK